MQGMFPVKRTIFAKFQLFLGIAAVFLGGIISPLTFAALQCNQFNCGLFTGHFLLLNPLETLWRLYKEKSPRPKCCVFWPALDQNRTDDLILTMDMLCQLSYKGKFDMFPIVM